MTPRLMLAAASSGSGKTTIACAILQALTRMGEHPVSFKCGPDYIDPMFHRQVLGVPSRNLDLFFSDEATAAYLLQKNSENFSLAFIEGVRATTNGIATTTEASSCSLPKPPKRQGWLLVLNCKGMSVSIAAQLGGYLSYQPDSQIKGVILNQVSKSIYPEIKALIEQRYDVAVCGYMPKMSDCSLESRHLGLVTAEEIGDLQQRLEKLGEQAMQTIDLPLLLKIAAQAPALAIPPVQLPAPNPTRCASVWRGIRRSPFTMRIIWSCLSSWAHSWWNFLRCTTRSCPMIWTACCSAAAIPSCMPTPSAKTAR